MPSARKRAGRARARPQNEARSAGRFTNPPWAVAPWRLVLGASACGRSATEPRPPKECRTESPGRAARRALRAPPRRPARSLRADRFGSPLALEMLRPAVAGLRRKAKWRRGSPAGRSRANPCGLVTSPARPPEEKKCSAAREAHEKGEPARTAEGMCLRASGGCSLPHGLETERMVERVEKSGKRLGENEKGSTSQP
jgi:hypothetical protein